MVTVSWNEDLGQKLFDAIRPYVEKQMEDIVSTDEPWPLNHLVDLAQSHSVHHLEFDFHIWNSVLSRVFKSFIIA